MIHPRSLVLLIGLLIAFATPKAFALKLIAYKVSDTIPVKNISKQKLMKYAEDWFDSEKPKLKLIRKNTEQFVLEGKGFLPYYNHVNLEDVFLSPRAAERTNGNIVYYIRIIIQDSVVIAEFSEFNHEPYFNEYGSFSFGKIYDYENAPPGVCMENKQWCNMVWQEMKSRSTEDVLDHSSRLIPESARRKKGKVFKVEKEDVPVEVVKENPDDYLKIENYMMKDDGDTVETPKQEPTKKKRK